MCRLRIKMVARVTMEDLVAHLDGSLAEWPAKELQALEICMNSPFINHPKLLYLSRTLFPLDQVRNHPFPFTFTLSSVACNVNVKVAF